MAAPPSAPIIGGQQAYRDLIASGNYTADDIMATVYGLPDIPDQPKRDMAKADPTGMMDNPESKANIQRFIAGGDTQGLTDYLASLGTYDFSPTGVSLENQYQEGLIGIEEYEFLGSLFKQTGDIAAIHTQYGVPIGGDPYKGIYNPYAPPEEIDSRLYAPATPNIGFEELPLEETPGTVRYDKEGRQLGPLYGDIIDDANAVIDARSAEMDIDPDEYVPGGDSTLDAAYKSLDDAYAARSAAEESIAMDESGAKAPHEVDDTPPPPAPEITQFRTRTRGGARGF